MVNAVVMAGGKEKLGHYKSKATLEFNNKRCIDYVVKALDDAENIDDVIIVGDRENLGDKVLGYNVTQERGVFIPNGLIGYEHFRIKLGNVKNLFYVYSDIPFVNSESIDDFLEKCDKRADLNLCFVDINKIEEKFPGYKKYYPHARFNDFNYRMGNCALINIKKMLDNSGDKFFEKAHKARRVNELGAKIRLAFLAYPIYLHLKGIKGFFKEFYFNLEIKNVEKIISKAISKKGSLNVKIVKSYYPELAVDVDSKRDKNYIENYFNNLLNNIK